MAKCVRCGNETDKKLHYGFGETLLGLTFRWKWEEAANVPLCDNCMKEFKVWLASKPKKR
jgi:hypothetical protein